MHRIMADVPFKHTRISFAEQLSELLRKQDVWSKVKSQTCLMPSAPQRQHSGYCTTNYKYKESLTKNYQR